MFLFFIKRVVCTDWRGLGLIGLLPRKRNWDSKGGLCFTGVKECGGNSRVAGRNLAFKFVCHTQGPFGDSWKVSDTYMCGTHHVLVTTTIFFDRWRSFEANDLLSLGVGNWVCADDDGGLPARVGCLSIPRVYLWESRESRELDLHSQSLIPYFWLEAIALI